ncbi:MAG: hypothetical protein H8E82_04310, partial [Candidatus Marinimicrobia bacterium]|nr:hypothetical protein [Candidatus Neomarinimicrobiota bacterium]
MRKIINILLSVIFMASFSFGEEIVINNSEFTLDVITSNDQQTVIEYNFGRFERFPVDINGKLYYRLYLAGEAVTFEKGAPELPKITRSIIIPDDAKVRVSIVEKEYVEYQMPVASSKGLISRSVNPDDVPYTFSDVYQKNVFYPVTVGELGTPYILRDFRGITVTAYPFLYNPVTQTLRVYTHLIFEINTIGIGDVNVKYRKTDRYNKYFEGIYSSHFINFDMTRYESIDEHGRIIVISYGSFMEEVQPYVDWKNQKGIQCNIYDVDGSEVGGTAYSIKAFIQEQYDIGDGMTFVQLVGDAAQVPTLSASGSASDPSYAFLEGNDVYPEIFIGRFSAQNISEVETQVERTVHYERDIVDGEWLHKGTGIASNQGPGDDGETDDEHEDNIRMKLLNFTYTEVDQIYDPFGSVTDGINALNEGRGIVNYTGHGSPTSWGNGAPLNNSDVNGLTNDYMLPFISSVACNNGEFNNYGTCFAEAWLRATNGSTGAPTGAIAMYASSISQSWSPPMRSQDHAIDLLVGWDYSNDEPLEQKNTIGGLWFNGSCNMVDVYGNVEIANWTIFGDASLQVRTDTPEAINISHIGTLFIGTNSYSVSTGVEDALVALSEGGILLASGYTDETGDITLVLDNPPTAPTELTLTVSAFNKITTIEPVTVIAPEGPYIIISDFSVNAGGDGVIEFGETVNVSVDFSNVGVDSANDVVATISTDDSYISLTDAEESVGFIAADEVVTVSDAFSFIVANNVPDNHPFSFNVVITAIEDTWEFENGLSMTAYAPVILVGSVSVQNDD